MTQREDRGAVLPQALDDVYSLSYNKVGFVHEVDDGRSDGKTRLVVFNPGRFARHQEHWLPLSDLTVQPR